MSFVLEKIARHQKTGAADTKALLLCLAAAADNNGESRVSLALLAEQTELSEDEVHCAFDRLEENGLIYRPRATGSDVTCVVLLDELCVCRADRWRAEASAPR